MNICILPPFIDDIIIKGRDFNEHLTNTRTILDDIKNANFTLNALKCSFFQTKINYLGHVIANNKISLDPERISAIISLPSPNNVKSLHSFIGMTQFCSRFVHNLKYYISSTL